MKDSSGFVKIPSVTDDVCDRNGGTSITYNAALAGKKAADVKDSYATIVLFETPGKGRNKSGPYKEQPFETSPVIVKGERRGWIQQPLSGQASYKDKFGNVKAAPSAGGVKVRGSVGEGSAPVEISSTPSKKDAGK